jgi:hypothetical protein
MYPCRFRVRIGEGEAWVTWSVRERWGGEALLAIDALAAPGGCRSVGGLTPVSPGFMQPRPPPHIASKTYSPTLAWTDCSGGIEW